MQRLLRLAGVTWVVGLLTIASGATLQIDDFESGTTEGWTGGAAPSLQAAGGPDGDGDAFLMISARGGFGPGSNLAAQNSQADWTGDYAALDAGVVNVDLMNPLDSQPLEVRLVIFGPSNTNQRWTSTVSTAIANDGAWNGYEFRLAEDDLTRVLGTSNYNELQGNVLRIMLRHDAGAPSAGGTPISARLGIDNVSLAAVPPLLAADFNEDGNVDGADLAIWGGAFGANGDADSDGDNDSDGADFLAWQRQFNGDNSSTDVVPEPHSLMLLLGLLAAPNLVRCRRPLL